MSKQKYIDEALSPFGFNPIQEADVNLAIMDNPEIGLRYLGASMVEEARKLQGDLSPVQRLKMASLALMLKNEKATTPEEMREITGAELVKVAGVTNKRLVAKFMSENENDFAYHHAKVGIEPNHNYIYRNESDKPDYLKSDAEKNKVNAADADPRNAKTAGEYRMKAAVGAMSPSIKPMPQQSREDAKEMKRIMDAKQEEAREAMEAARKHKAKKQAARNSGSSVVYKEKDPLDISVPLVLGATIGAMMGMKKR